MPCCVIEVAAFFGADWDKTPGFDILLALDAAGDDVWDAFINLGANASWLIWACGLFETAAFFGADCDKTPGVGIVSTFDAAGDADSVCD